MLERVRCATKKHLQPRRVYHRPLTTSAFRQHQYEEKTLANINNLITRLLPGTRAANETTENRSDNIIIRCSQWNRSVTRHVRDASEQLIFSKPRLRGIDFRINV